MKTLRFLVTVFVAVAGDGPLYLQAALAAPPAPVVLVDSTGKTAARALNDTLTLIRVSPEVAAPAFIRPIYDADGRTASGLATWASGGAVLFTSADCSTGAHIHTLSNAGLRSTSQVETPGGTVLYVGAIGMPMTEDVRSILYASGCSRVTVRQNGLVAVVATINLTTTYPPPLTLQ